MKNLTGILVKPAGADCNLRCRYCFYIEKKSLYPAGPRRMTPLLLRTLIKKAMQAGAPSISFCWQGGEPTLMGREFFERAVQLQRQLARPGQIAANSLQTNGLRLDDAFCAFLARSRFLVGLSLDGPCDVHDTYRVSADGCGTWDRVRAAAEMLFAHGVETNALVMVTDRTRDRLDDIWEAILELDFKHLQFIPCLERDPEDPSRLAPWSVSADDYGEVLCQLFDRWTASFVNGAPTVFIRLFEALLFGYVGRPVPLCQHRPTCGEELVVEHNGDVYSCDFFVDPEHHLGNVMEDDLGALLVGERQRRFGQSKADVPDDCEACPWLRRCNGGCLKDRSRNPSGDSVNPLCAAYKRFFEHADPRFRQIAARLQRRGI